MPRPRSSAESDVMSALREYSGEDIHYPATLTTLYAVRNAVYRYNRESGKKFRCIIRDDGVVLTEREGRSAHDAASKAIKEIMTSAKSKHETDVDTLVTKIRSVLESYFNEDEFASNNDDESESESEDMTPRENIRRKRR